MNDWIILGIEKTDDLRKVKQAYAEKTKLYHPETHPEEFQKLHNAYKRIIAEIRGSTDYPKQIQVQNPKIVRQMEKQLEIVHKSVRDTKQDEDFLKQVEVAEKNFEARHTDKSDPVQTAKVEYILQHDDRNSKLLKQFQWLLHNEFFAEGWRDFFISEEFLKRQYEPEFINGMTEILKSRLQERQGMKKCSVGLGVMMYFIIVYGAIFEGFECLQFDKQIYQKELLQRLVDVFLVSTDKRDSYLQIEQNAMLLGERYAFFLYRRILEELDADRPVKENIVEVLIEGFQKRDISKVFFDLLLYLLTSNGKNIPVFKVALAQACEMEWDSSIQDEIEILKLELNMGEQAALKAKELHEDVKQEMHQEMFQETQTIEAQIKNRQTIEQRKVHKEEKHKKLNRVIGKWIWGIAGIILCINVFCRMVDAVKSMEYVQVMGTVTKVAMENSGRVRAGNRIVESYSYSVWVEYPIRGIDYSQKMSENHSFKMFSKGDTVPVLYRQDAIYEAYIAKKDWMTGAYLPMSKSYNVPLIISIVLFVLGFLIYTNSPILEWFSHAGEIKIGKKKPIDSSERITQRGTDGDDMKNRCKE